MRGILKPEALKVAKRQYPQLHLYPTKREDSDCYFEQ
jgi:hypothetical protein